MPQRFIAGVDLGGTHVRVVIANEDGEIEARRVTPYAGGDPERVLASVRRTADDLVRSVWPGADVAGIGMALPGTVDPGRGTVATAANLPGWGAVDIREALAGPKRTPVAVENDANAAAVGEGWLGVAKGMADFVFVALGTGIGTGIVLGGRLHRGAHFLAGEAAFFPMTREHVRAPDWQAHCLEGMVGGRAMAIAATEILGQHAKPGDLFDAAERGEEAASAWLAATQEHLAMAVADIIALLDPQAVVFGGGVTAAQGEALLGRVRDLATKAAPFGAKVLQTSLGEDAQILGAVRLALDAVLA